MAKKLYKYQILILFVLTLINAYYFFFSNSLPDNALEITSNTNSVFGLSYYFSSFVAYVSFFTGPWIIFSFLATCFAYSFVVSRRDKDIDIAIPTILFTFFLSTFYLLTPKLLGKGLYDISSIAFSGYTYFFTSLILFFVITYHLFNNNFFVFFKTLKLRLEHASSGVLNGLRKINIKKKENKKPKLLETKTSKVVSIKEKTAQKVSSAKEAIVNTKDTITNLVTSKKELQEQTIEEITAPKTQGAIDKVDFEWSKDDESSLEIKSDEPVVAKKKKQVQPEFFNSKDLINCISTTSSSNKTQGPDSEYFYSITKAIEEKLAEFKISATIINVLKGPVVDTFELDLGEGVKLSKVLNVSDDIGLALNGVPIRIVYPLRGKSTIGIEVPRNPREFIYLDEILKSNSFNDSTHRLPVAMGKDAFGNVTVVDLAGMPHMLVAGATGAGKSVFINALLTSLIIKKSPSELKLILIDPKQLELATFQDLPHLAMPVLTDPKSSSIALLWLVQEMDRRYTILKDMGVKNIEGFNRKVKKATPAQLSKIAVNYEDVDTQGYELPYMVCVIDEFADLILTKMGKEIETNVNRLAAKARAAGIHMVVATQRPSTDVVTGVIKANFPTRVAFRVTTGHDSKTILDQYGAQKLLGRGDMLYKHGVELLRLHSSYVDEDEIEGLVTKLAQIPSEYNNSAVNFLENGGEEDDSTSNGEVKTYRSGTTDDPVYDEAVQIVLQKGSASASMLQRALRVGYNRAANIIEEMERNGIVGPAQGSKPRQILVRSGE
ncbi:MAG: DNA translocase FtsK [Bacteriovoracaceae bacterium]|jgi:S-DNA-T family DNA segregation ATPase FtsK/SpoIIIE|nr:DNA translocase FtsK [Bacteriovoracaceae bacterium]